MSSYCSSCGTALRDGAKFCGKCGTKVEGIKPTKSVKTIQTTHSSKTKVVVLAVVIIVVAGAIGYLLFFNLFPSGMIQNNTNNTENVNSFIGKWKVVSQAEHYITFYANNSLYVEMSYQGQSENSWHNYIIKNEQLQLYPEGDMIYTVEQGCLGTNSTFDYEFSNGDSQIILMNSACNPDMVLNKVQ
jgi:hypothetical protein